MENNAAASGDKVTPVEIVKVCRVHGKLGRGDVYVAKRKHEKNSYRCRTCCLLYSKAWCAKHPKRVAERKRKNYIKTRENFCHYSQKNKDRLRPKDRLRHKKGAQTLSEPYIKRLLVKGSKILKSSDIGQNLIELKRTTLLIKRSIRNGQHS